MALNDVDKTNNSIMEKQKEQVVESLNQLLINYQVHYQNLRLFHWNVKGPFFFVLHAKFEELYLDAALKVDEIAERILALEGTPKGSLKNILKHAQIESYDEVINAENMVEAIVSANIILINNVEELLKIAAEANDEGTLDIFTSYIQLLQKENWMLKSFLKN
jgi:starvation-inducible DNA-binding protein